MPLILPGNVASATASTTYTVANSCRFNSGDSPSLKDGDGSAPAGNRQKFTFSVWFKRAKLGVTQMFAASAYDSSDEGYLYISGGDVLVWHHSSSGMGQLVTTQKFMDVGAWYHLVWSVDTTQGTDSNRMKFYINGSQVTSFSTETYPDENKELYWNVGGTYYPWIGRRHGGDYFDGYMAEVVHIDNAQLAATSFGEFDSDSPTIWKPIDVSGLTFGTAGYWLDFEDSSNFGNDVSGVGNHFGTVANLAATDQATDTPTNNFCTLNPLIWVSNQDAVTFSEGNTRSDHDDSNGNQISWGTMMVNAGKWYWEVKVVDVGYTYIGVWQTQGAWTNPGVYDGLSGVTTYRGDDGKTNDENVGLATYGDSYTDGDIISVAVNVDTGTIWFAKNGTWQNSATEAEIEAGTTTNAAFTGKAYATNGIVPSITGYSTTEYHVNFGNPPYANSSSTTDANGYGDFEYSVPDGFLALCTKNLGSDGG